MTLDTRFAITSPVLKPREVFDHCNTLLAAASGRTVESIETNTFDPGGNQWVTLPGWYNTIGQGLCALMDVHYGPDGPMKRECYCDELVDFPEAEPGEDRRCSGCQAPEAFVEVSFDTAYSYTGPFGGCGDLHSALVDRLGAWCDERGLSWSWQNEFTGEWHVGRDGLDELGDGGRRATAWFTTEAWPAIAAHAASPTGGRHHA